MIDKADGELDWTRPAAAPARPGFAPLDPARGAFYHLPGGTQSVAQPAVDPPRAGAPARCFLADPKERPGGGRGRGALAPDGDQGPRRQAHALSADYLRGHPMAEGAVLGAEHA